MTQYLGNLGAMVPVHSAASLSPSGERPMSLRTTLKGVRRAQHGQRVHRRWGVAVPPATRPEEAATLSAFVAGEWGTGPWWWVDEWAQVTNLASPRGAALEVGVLPSGVTLAGSVDLGGGEFAGRHLLSAGGSVDLPQVQGVPELVPVLPGRSVTVSAWVVGGTVAPVFRDAAGVVVAGGSAVAAAGSGWERVASTAVAPAGAVSVQVRVSGASKIARPAVTWSPQALGYHAGQGAPQVVVSALSQDVVLAGAGVGEQYAAASFTIEEVG